MSDQPVTLANCEDEPIHEPGAIQPHGALIALDEQGQVLGFSDNLGSMLGITPQLGLPLAEEDVGGNVLTMLAEGLRETGPWVNSVEARIGRRFFDVIGHSHEGVRYLEFERRASGTASFTTFALNAQRLVSQLQLRNDVESLLVSVTDEVRRMTGYDRVMAYRFNEDDSGEVVAEARREDLESYLGQRYPASDIPAQARRLYLQNPVRLIGDVAYQPVAVRPTLNPRSRRPFDLSFSTLRSVSPIHCEYLTNMGVRASMSISIVVAGRLWGLFSCHHMSPKVVPYPIRMSFQVFSQVCSAMVERLEQSRISELLRQASERQQALLRRTRDSDDLLSALTRPGGNVADLLPCDGAVVMLGGRASSIGGDFEEMAIAMVAQLQQDDDIDLFHSDQRLELPGDHDPRYCGVMAIRFHRQESGWIVWLRLEQVHRIRWGGKPEKIISTGPSGPRLTPRGSFEAWEEVVRGRSMPWTGIDLSIAEKLRMELVELCLNRAGEIDRMRQRLIAVLGHDLRNPLQSISMAAAMLSSSDVRNAELRQHITYSSSRMERLISQILEMSRLQSGGGMTVAPAHADLSRLVRDIVQETDVAYPGLAIETAIEDDVQAQVDPDRYLQVVANLLSNARHHGRPGRPVLVELSRQGDLARLSVLNEAEVLDEARLASLFLPFKQDVAGHGRNKSGLGIGLYISQAIVAAHGGRIEVDQADGIITFSVLVPLQPAT
ncbi:GAF domain-containing protein [Pseudomonas sp. PDNC002]|uniref:GAF domain-containing protein n=1 Tax=Pseudomonas sp. PDNC002 TaxID=2811422 RepID=UPI00196467B9|nr:GAF domain-containing protein [Pseudomonas sp. PDNC002]QRY79824.1 GAF domain-containing protein [Pseudomonas sp. PDNC002]